MLRSSYPLAYVSEGDRQSSQGRRARTRKARVEITGDMVDCSRSRRFEKASDLSKLLVDRYAAEETDSVYLVFNEFQSVISQRIVVERILPILEVGKPDIAGATEMKEEQIEEIARAAQSAGVSVKAEDKRRQTKRPRSLAPRKWTTFTSSRRANC